ncbi:MAG: terpene cyclase/mutase family protein, partial [Thermoleophilia bacterium]|nr:terpene cyclase/mutase family protein [Thermoleophilia bacterium]
MIRIAIGLAAAGLVLVPPPQARAQTPAELEQTARVVAALQNPDGGFGATPGGPSSLGSTSSAIRILKYCGGAIPDVHAAIKFVRSCYESRTGGFRQVPGSAPDVATTASGLMAMQELKIDDAEIVDKAVGFLSENARSFEELRIAVAGLEAAGKPSPSFPRWEAITR